MNRPILCLGVFALLFTGCLDLVPSIKGNGIKVTEERKITDFHEFSLAGIGTYQINAGPSAKLTLTAEENLLPFLVTAMDVAKDQLHIGIKSGSYSWNITPSGEITVKELKSVLLQGQTSVEAKGINTKSFGVKMEGQSGVTLSGAVEEQVVRVDGQSKYMAADLKCKKAKIVCNGMCTITVQATEEIEVEANGMCTVEVIGKPAKKNIKTAGMSKVVEK